MPTLNKILRAVLSLAIAVVFFVSPLGANDWRDPQGVCKDSRGCGSGSSGGSSSSAPLNISPGAMTKRVWGNVNRQCGSAPLCWMLPGAIALTLAVAIDAPVFAVKGVVSGLYYGGKGLYYGTRGIGRGVAVVAKAPFKRAAAKRAALANSPAPSCSGTSGEGFDAYRSWESCKRAVLKRQNALTQQDPSNKANEDWCKTHIPLSFGPNRMGWEERCNKDGQAALVQSPEEKEAAKAGVKEVGLEGLAEDSRDAFDNEKKEILTDVK